MMITNSSLSEIFDCIILAPFSFVFFIYNTINILFLLPTCSFALYLGLQRWRRRSSATAAAMSPSDSFNYHMVALQLVGVCGSIICCCGIFSHEIIVLTMAQYLLCFTWTGEVLLHTLTCLERYLAVVHPITYLSLKTERGVRVRNITYACVWLLCFLMMCAFSFNNYQFNLFIMFFFLIVISFCSLSVLCALTRPGPGGRGGDRAKVDLSKQRAFYTITTILAVLVLRFTGNLIWVVMFAPIKISSCLTLVLMMWSNLPSSLVFPAMFLHRAGKVVCCRNKI